MKKQVKICLAVGAFITIVLGTLLHFFYEYTGRSAVAALISPVNESVWEHLKLLFMPSLFFGAVEYFVYGKKEKGFFFSKAIGILTGILAILLLFYTYSGILGDNFVIADIAIFIIAVIIAYVVEYKLILSGTGKNENSDLLGFVILILLFLIFVYFTFYPPHIPLFQDSTNGLYGVEKLPKN